MLEDYLGVFNSVIALFINVITQILCLRYAVNGLLKSIFLGLWALVNTQLKTIQIRKNIFIVFIKWFQVLQILTKVVFGQNA